MATTQDSKTTPAEAAVDYAGLKERQRLAWQSGDYPRVGVMLQLIAEHLVETADVRAGQRVLDVACGQGNAALAAAKRNAEATGVDYAPNLLEQGRERVAFDAAKILSAGVGEYPGGLFAAGPFQKGLLPEPSTNKAMPLS
jgi:2-polyprenyl-3-methyl-5-hydroxy-6-metoxy-1,4-benzoquinol methylase